MTDNYTPGVDEMRAAIKKSLHYLRGAYQIRTPAKRDESIREAYGTLRGFDRMIAQVRAETLREAREALIVDQVGSYGIVLPDVNDAVDLLNERADRIEKEAGL